MSVLSSIADLYLDLNDLENALASRQQCVDIVSRLPVNRANQIALSDQLTAMGSVYLARCQLDLAEHCFRQNLAISSSVKLPVQDRVATSISLAHCLQQQGRSAEAVIYLKQALKAAKECSSRRQECYVYGQFSAVAQSRGNWSTAKKWAERQLHLALKLKDAQLEGTACGCLGVYFERVGDYANAKRLHSRHLQLAGEAGDKCGLLQARRHLAACLHQLGDRELALTLHKAELQLANELKVCA